MPRYKLTIEYDGTGLHGWQRQENGRSVQALLEDAALQFCQEEVLIYGAGRTDAGVHARGQVAHCDFKENYQEETIRKALNFYLKGELVSVLAVTQVNNEFHARFSATKREYLYQIINRPSPLTLERLRAWHLAKPLDVTCMQEAANVLIGKHDFSSFRASDCQAQSPVKTIDSIDIETHGEHIDITITAQSFLYHMVRNIVGMLRRAGEGKLSIDAVQELLAAKDRTLAPSAAPAHGLYLTKVVYEDA